MRPTRAAKFVLFAAVLAAGVAVAAPPDNGPTPPVVEVNWERTRSPEGHRVAVVKSPPAPAVKSPAVEVTWDQKLSPDGHRVAVVKSLSPPAVAAFMPVAPPKPSEIRPVAATVPHLPSPKVEVTWSQALSPEGHRVAVVKAPAPSAPVAVARSAPEPVRPVVAVTPPAPVPTPKPKTVEVTWETPTPEGHRVAVVKTPATAVVAAPPVVARPPVSTIPPPTSPENVRAAAAVLLAPSPTAPPVPEPVRVAEAKPAPAHPMPIAPPPFPPPAKPPKPLLPELLPTPTIEVERQLPPPPLPPVQPVALQPGGQNTQGGTDPPPRTPLPDSVTQPPPRTPLPDTVTPPAAAPAPTTAGSAAAAGLPSSTQAETGTRASAPPAATAPPAAAGSTTSALSGAAGQAGQAFAAPSVADVIAKAPTTTGVEVQRRNAVVADARIRGLRAGQYAATGNWGTFLPARLDLDTAVSKFDPSSLREVTVIKGPYSVLYGPAFSVLDVNTLDSPRYECYETHGRTGLSYQSNGDRFDALQSVWGGNKFFGFRATFNYLQGNDYRSGDGTRVPASYESNNFNFALGADITEKTRLELKGLRVIQGRLEFPGQYFDVSGLDTTALSGRFTWDDLGPVDRVDFRAWYNSTAASGDTASGAKQAFVQQVLFQSFNTQFAPGFPLARGVTNPAVAAFADESNTRFANRSIGYRLMFNWGPKDDPLVIVGHDLNVYGQGLVENIRLVQTQGPNANTGQFVSPGSPQILTQTQTIPGANQVDAGLFAQLRLPVTDALTVRTGGRVDLVKSSSNPRLISGNIDLFGAATTPGGASFNRFQLDPSIYSVDPTSPDLTRTHTLLAGFLQAEYKLDKHWTAMAAVGHAQRAPTLTELYASGPFVGVLQQGTSRLIGDPNLSPERLTQFDVGVRADYEFMQLGANAYYASIRDYITFDLNKSGAGLIQAVYSNTDRATLVGTELFAQLELTAWMTPFATLSFVQGIDTTARDTRRPQGLASSRRDDPLAGFRKAATEPLPQIPPLESRLGFRLHAESKTPWWQLELSARVVAGQNNVATSLGEIATPGFTTFTARGFVRVTPTWLVSAGVENFGDKNYREHLDPISGNLQNVGALLRPGANFFFGVQATY
jgi:iron complex outermembrane receptor protein